MQLNVDVGLKSQDTNRNFREKKSFFGDFPQKIVRTLHRNRAQRGVKVQKVVAPRSLEFSIGRIGPKVDSTNQDPLSKGRIMTDICGSNHNNDVGYASPLLSEEFFLFLKIVLA